MTPKTNQPEGSPYDRTCPETKLKCTTGFCLVDGSCSIQEVNKHCTCGVSDKKCPVHIDIELATPPATVIQPLQWQLCPKCNGQGTVSKPPWLAGDVNQWSSTSVSFPCDVCNGAKILAPPSTPPNQLSGIEEFRQKVIDSLYKFYELGDEIGYSNSELSRIGSCIQKVKEVKAGYATSEGEEAIGFAEWKDENYVQSAREDRLKYYFARDKKDMKDGLLEYKTIPELYNLYKLSKK